MLRERDRLTVEVEVGDEAVVRFTGSGLSLTEENARSLDRLLSAAAGEARGRNLVLDFSNVEFLSSAALDALVRLHLQLKAAGGRLAVRRLDDELYELFEVTRLTSLFEVCRGGGRRRNAPPCVLVADDEDALRLLLGRALRRGGLKAALAATGREAVALFRQDPEGIAVALLDVRMPGLSGPETLAALRLLNPEVRCCFMTGDSDPSTEEGLRGLGAARVFHKPFALDEVVQSLRVLAGAAPLP
jgi:anti-anti-sigma factor